MRNILPVLLVSLTLPLTGCLSDSVIDDASASETGSSTSESESIHRLVLREGNTQLLIGANESIEIVGAWLGNDYGGLDERANSGSGSSVYMELNCTSMSEAKSLNGFPSRTGYGDYPLWLPAYGEDCEVKFTSSNGGVVMFKVHNLVI